MAGLRGDVLCRRRPSPGYLLALHVVSARLDSTWSHAFDCQ